MAAALFRAAAANPKLTQSIAQAASKGMKDPKGMEMFKSASGNLLKDPKLLASGMDALKSASSQVRENLTSASNRFAEKAASGTVSTTYETKRDFQEYGICRLFIWIWDRLKILFRFLFLTRSPAAYVVWLLIIIAIILGVAFGVHFGRKRSTLAKNKI